MNATGPLLTIVLSSYNYGRYISAAMNALEPQLGPDAHLLVVDDASTDDSLEALRGYAARNTYMTLESNTDNTGIHAVLNQGLALVRGPWVLYSAMDDLVYPGLVARMLPLLRRYPQAGLCTAPADYLNAEGGYLSPWMGPALSDDAYCTPDEVGAIMRRYGFWFAGMTTALAVAPLRKAGGFQRALGHMADSFASQELALRHGMSTVAAPLAGVRQVPRGYSRRNLDDPRAAEEVRKAALERMRSLPEFFPLAFQRDWKAFSSVWDCLRAWKHGPCRAEKEWLDKALAKESGVGRLLLRLTVCGRAVQLLVLGVFAVASLWKNPLFRVRVSRLARRKRASAPSADIHRRAR